MLLGVVGIWTGEAWARFGLVVNRANEPEKFWEAVGMRFLIGTCFIGYFLYRVFI